MPAYYRIRRYIFYYKAACSYYYIVADGYIANNNAAGENSNIITNGWHFLGAVRPYCNVMRNIYMLTYNRTDINNCAIAMVHFKPGPYVCFVRQIDTVLIGH